jgi:phosphatidylglycerophosphate synthase
MPAYVEALIAARGTRGAPDVGADACHPAGTEAERRAAAEWIYSFRCKPELDNVLVRNVYRPVSGVLTRLFVRLPFTPNMITAVAILCGQLGCLLAARPGYRDHVIGLFFVAFVSGILDCVDGEVARVRLQRSKLGAWLDAVGDDVLRVTLILAIGSHAAARYPDLPIGWITLGSAALTALAMVPMYWYCVTVLRSPNLQTYRTAMSGPSGSPATAWIGRLGVEVAGRDFVDLAMFVLAVLDLPIIGVFGLAVGGAVAFAVVIPTHLRTVR